MSDFLNATEAPHTLNGTVIPKITLRNLGKLASACKAAEVAKLRELIAEEDVKPEVRARFLALTVARDFTITDVWDWSVSLDGGIAVLKAALMQSGEMKEKEADAFIDTLSAESLLTAAMEACDHVNAPSRIAARELKAPKKPEGDAPPK